MVILDLIGVCSVPLTAIRLCNMHKLNCLNNVHILLVRMILMLNFVTKLQCIKVIIAPADVVCSRISVW